MQPLIDGDILLYEIGYGAEVGWRSIKEEAGEEYSPPPFDYVERLLNERIQQICDAVDATEKPRIFLTGDNNFRFDIATVKPYKGNRDESHKPFHHRNIFVYLKAAYDAEVVDGIEADDQMAIEQTSQLDSCSTIICTRDKDLRQVPGWHYGWELGRQPAFGPTFVEEEGHIELANGQVKGDGLAFFYAQCIMGDSTDNIPGIPRKGAVHAYKRLSGCKTPEDMLECVRSEYRAKYGDSGDEMLLEQGRLLWMVREIKDGKPVMWSFE